jgi:diguanylate cyclase (GGDEF)-like protein
VSPGDRLARNPGQRRKPRLVPTLLLIAALAAGLGGVATFVLLKVQYDILRLANHTTGKLLPEIQAEVRTAINLERLQVFGEVIRNSPEPRERREALLAARILTMDVAYERDARIKEEVRRAFEIFERLAARRAARESAGPPREAEQIEIDPQASRDWAEARAILDNLVQHLSIGAAVDIAEGSAEIARYANNAMWVVTGVLGGLILLFAASIYFVQRTIIKPIIRVTNGLERVKATHGGVRLRRERLRELDDIAAAVEAFGAALAQISERTTQLEREVAERQAAQAQLLELATTDSLTGLRNRRYFMETASQEFERSRRYQIPLSLLMLDADRFKSINDRFGHHVGDEALKALAAIGQRQLREIDLFARLGGEEFAILLPQTDFADARAVAERLRQTIAGQMIDTEQGPFNFTVSLGLASLDPAMTKPGDLLRQADIALYQAKHNGRNRVEPAQPPGLTQCPCPVPPHDGRTPRH